MSEKANTFTLMHKSEQKKQNILFIKLSFLFLAIIICIVAFLSLQHTFSWFAENRSVNATGMNIEVYTPPGIDVESWQFNTDRTFAEGQKKTISPGEHGTIEVTFSSEDRSVNVSLEARVNLTPGAWGATTGSTQEQALHAQGYFNKHIYLFTDYNTDTKEYSGWIRNNTTYPYEIGVTKPIVIYWVWRESYDSFGEGINIAKADYDLIQQDLENNPWDYMDRRSDEGSGNITSEKYKFYYDYADDTIKRYIARIQYYILLSD